MLHACQIASHRLKQKNIRGGAKDARDSLRAGKARRLCVIDSKCEQVRLSGLRIESEKKPARRWRFKILKRNGCYRLQGALVNILLNHPLTFSASLNEDYYMADELKPTYGLPEALRGQRKKRPGRKTRAIVGGDKWKTYTHAEGTISKENFTSAIDRAIENIELTRRRMANDQIEIDRLRVETQQMIAELLT